MLLADAQRALDPEINAATIRLLNRQGWMWLCASRLVVVGHWLIISTLQIKHMPRWPRPVQLKLMKSPLAR